MFIISFFYKLKIELTFVKSVKYERRVIFTLFHRLDLEIIAFDVVPGGSLRNFRIAGCKSNIHI